MNPPTEAPPAALEAGERVSALYAAHALSLVKVAVLLTSDQPTAEDVVQDAFLGLYRRWDALDDPGKAVGYLRSSVINGCRAVHRNRFRRMSIVLDPPELAASAEAGALLSEAHREVLAALRGLPPRGGTIVCGADNSGSSSKSPVVCHYAPATITSEVLGFLQVTLANTR